ncbi:MAG: TIGR03663 family protein [Thermomicrobiales bacterium]|nr:TIGR03663 family protein [Thermomicrobiales bacterium]
MAVMDGNGRIETTPSQAPGVRNQQSAVGDPGTAEQPFRLRITLEGLLYLAAIVAAALTRFWDLGSRALHHDESLHAYFSWLYATGQGYTHDPLMHGPFLFHANALVYLLLGATDASSRFWPALLGTVLVALPWFLRGPRHLGRWGALAASFLLLISPTLLYQERYIRHDIFTVVGSMVLFIGMVRYVERPRRRWLIVMGASLGFLIANHEIVFGIAAIFVATLIGALLWGQLRPLIPLLAASGVAALTLIAKLPTWTGRPLPTIPWSGPTQQQQIDFYQSLLTNPLPWALLLLAIVTIAAAALLLRDRRDPERVSEGWIPALLGDSEPGTVAHAVNAAWADRTGLGIAAAVFGVIFAVFFTSMFTNVYGLATGTIATDGTLLYWLGQHDYRRGEQPWFYYLLLFPQYEPIAVLFGTGMMIAVGWQALRVALGRAAGPRFFFHMALALWYVGIFLALSWAGEKMPWLIVHITLPALLLAAALIGALVERWQAARRPSAAGWLTTALLIAAIGWFFIAGRLTYGEFVPSQTPGGWSRAVAPDSAAVWWLLAVPPLVALLAVGAGWVRLGTRRTGEATLTAVLAGLTLLQIHGAWRMTYLEGDIPKDMLIYTQTSPDVKRMTDELTQLSEQITGGKDLEIWYDDNNGVSWPMQWYLRDFPNRHLYSGSLSATPTAPIVLVGGDNVGHVSPYMSDYTAQEYVLRWWFPEDPVYRNFAIAPELNPGRSAWKSASAPDDQIAILRSVGSSLAQLLTPEGQQRVYRLAMYRDLPARIDAYRYTLYVRNDLLPRFNQIRYGR